MDGHRDYDGLSHLLMGMGSSGASGAYDIDFFAYKDAVHAPIPEPSTLLLATLAALGLFAARRRRDSA